MKWDVGNEFGHLNELAFSKSRVTHEPRINQCETRTKQAARESGVVEEPAVHKVAQAAGKLNEEGEKPGDIAIICKTIVTPEFLVPDPNFFSIPQFLRKKSRVLVTKIGY
jgi:hypothetical protein